MQDGQTLQHKKQGRLPIGITKPALERIGLDAIGLDSIEKLLAADTLHNFGDDRFGIGHFSH